MKKCKMSMKAFHWKSSYKNNKHLRVHLRTSGHPTFSPLGWHRSNVWHWNTSRKMDGNGSSSDPTTNLNVQPTWNLEKLSRKWFYLRSRNGQKRKIWSTNLSPSFEDAKFLSSLCCKQRSLRILVLLSEWINNFEKIQTS